MTFGVIAFLIMRLKLFFTPHLCVTVAFLASKEVFGFLRTNHRNALVIGLLALMTIKGQANVREQMVCGLDEWSLVSQCCLHFVLEYWIISLRNLKDVLS
eukprot:m.42586 g.42586  ORF g.42586 m.42586 type:complete len:100 (+) comp33366_c0_seq16:1594-1893(+)